MPDAGNQPTFKLKDIMKLDRLLTTTTKLGESSVARWRQPSADMAHKGLGQTWPSEKYRPAVVRGASISTFSTVINTSRGRITGSVASHLSPSNESTTGPPFLSIIGNLASVEPADLIPIIIRPDHNTELIGG